MDKATLVDKDIKIGNDVIGLLTAAGIPILEAFWAYMPQIEEWRLILTPPKVQQMGVRGAYIALTNVLHSSPLLDVIPLRRISLLSPKDQVVQSLKTLDSYPYEGTLHIVRSRSATGRVNSYLVTFAPYRGPGGAVPTVSLEGEKNPQDFLTNQIGIDEYEVVAAVRELGQRSSFSFPNVRLSTSDLRRLKMLPTWSP